MILRTLYHLIRADFLERTRRYSFLITIAVMVYVGYIAVPPAESGRLTINLSNIRGVYNSAWIGSMIAVFSSMLLSLAGFYLVKGAVQRDRETGVGQILATTPLSKALYTLGKIVSNFFFLAVIVGVVAVSAGIMQFVRGEVMRLDLWALVAPFLFITLPTMALVAAVAVVFEMIPLLRKGFGNIAYFVLYLVSVTASLGGTSFNERGVIEEPINDLFGVTAIGHSMLQAAGTAFPGRSFDFGVGMSQVDGVIRTFEWTGLQWSAGLIAGRLLWVGVAVAIALLAAIPFDRFDPAREGALRRSDDQDTADDANAEPAPTPTIATQPVELTPLPDNATTPIAASVVRLVITELKLLLKGQRWWWYLGAAGLIVAGAFAPPEALLPIAWVWPVLVWSDLGTREARYQTAPVVFSVPAPVWRQLPATWLAGVLLTVLMGSGVALQLLGAGAWGLLGAWFVGALFIPSLALTFGVWSGRSKLFEAAYVVIWYIGPLNKLPQLDFMGVTEAARSAGMPLVYMIITIALCVLAVVGRHRHVRGSSI